MKMRKLYIVTGILAIFLLTTSVNEGIAQGDWQNFTIDTFNYDNSLTIGGIGIQIFDGSDDSKYDVTVDLRIDTMPEFSGGGILRIVYNMSIWAASEKNDFGLWSYQPMKQFNATGEYLGIEIKDTVKVVLGAIGGSVDVAATGSYRTDDTVISSPGRFDDLDLNTIGAIAGSILSLAAIGYGVYKFSEGARFRKLVDQYLLNKDQSLRELVGNDDKKYVRMKKHLSERGLLRDSDM